MQTQDATRFRTEDTLSAWTEQLAELIPYPALQIDQRTNRACSRLYWNILSHGYICIDVFTPYVSEIREGCVVYVRLDNAGKARYESPQLFVYGDAREEVLVHFDLAIAELPDGFRLATSEDPPQVNRNGINYRQLIEFGRYLHELRTGRPM